MKLQAAALLCLALSCRVIAAPAPPTAGQVAEQRRGVGEEIAAGHIPKQMSGQYEKQTEALGQVRPDEQFTVTLSARDGRLLYLSTRGAKDPKAGPKTAIVLDGSTEYEADGKTAGMINSDGGRSAPEYHGENVGQLAFCPLPGVGLPGVDLIQSPSYAGPAPGGRFRFAGRVPLMNFVSGDSPYRAGEVEAVLTQGRLRVVSLTVKGSDLPEQRWKMTAFRLMHGHWVASAMSMTQVEEGGPEDEAEYHLAEVRPAALAPAAFEIGAYLAAGAQVFDGSGSSSSVVRYDPSGGPLKGQAAKAREAAAKKVSPTP